jgi:hypothetical protein
VTFPLINLISQVYAVENFLVNKSEAEILQWLQTKGKLRKVENLSSQFSTVYSFRSCFELNSGINFDCVFFIKDKQFIFIGDHTTFRPTQRTY